MDSCSLFNFFFGTKKATRELSKCFSSLAGGAHSQPPPQDGTRPLTPPSSPLRQLQMRLAGLAGASKRTATAAGGGSASSNLGVDRPNCTCTVDDATPNSHHRLAAGEALNLRCGTYRATLVHSTAGDDNDEDCHLDDRDELMDIDIVGNLSMRLHADQEDVQDEISITQDKHAEDNHNEEELRTPEPARCKPKRVVLYSDFTEPLEGHQELVSQNGENGECNGCNKTLADKRNVYVRNLVRSFENSNTFKISSESTTEKETATEEATRELNCQNSILKYSSTSTTSSPFKPKPPKTPPKTNKAKCLNWQLSLNKPTSIGQLFRDEQFLATFFHHLEPLERCAAAQVCRQWRNILYADTRYWKDLIIVIDCTQLRREHLIECILTTLQSAKWKQQGTNEQRIHKSANRQAKNHDTIHQTTTPNASRRFDYDTSGELQRRQQQWNAASAAGVIQELDQEDVWRIQELCNRFSQRTQVRQQQQSDEPVSVPAQQQHHDPTATTSKSSSIPSQISSTISSVSISSLLSPLSESSRVESLREKLYSSLDERGFEGICLFGATDEDIEDFVAKFPANARNRLTIARLNNCSLSNSGLESFITVFKRLEELELSGCNELTNVIDLIILANLKRLTITDCFNMADGLAQRLVPLVYKLDELTIQAYHLTDAFLEFLGNNGDTSALKRLELPNCKEITNQSLVIMAKYFPNLEALSISGSTKICDDGLEFLTEHARNLRVLNLSWCTKITDNSLERIASDLGDTLTDLILDRNINITNIGLGFLTKMSKLALLHIRWCSRISDMGLEAAVNIKSLRYLSLAGLHQITAGGLFYLIDTSLREVELTNCPAVNTDLIMFLSSKMPNCNIIY